MTQVDHTRMANAIRGLAMDAVEKAKSGHPGLPMGAADIATVLFTQFLKYDAAQPNWPDRDENELASRIQALGADRSRLADELDNSLVKTRRLERTNREISEKLDAAIGTIRAVLDTGEGS